MWQFHHAIFNENLLQRGSELFHTPLASHDNTLEPSIKYPVAQLKTAMVVMPSVEITYEPLSGLDKDEH